MHRYPRRVQQPLSQAKESTRAKWLLGCREFPDRSFDRSMLTLPLALQISAELAFPPAILNPPRVVSDSVEAKAVIAKFEAARGEREKTLSDGITVWFVAAGHRCS